MTDDEIKAAVSVIVQELERRVAIEGPDRGHRETTAAKIAVESAVNLLEAAQCNGLGGCILCQG